MQSLVPDEYERMLVRFYRFTDGIIRWLRIRYEDDGTRNVELEIACRDAHAHENDGWVSVRLLVRIALEFTIREQANLTLQVLSEGMQILQLDDAVGIVFGGALEPLETKCDMRKSGAFVMGKEIAIEVGPF